MHGAGEGLLEITWRNQNEFATLRADFKAKAFGIEFSKDGENYKL